MNWTRLILTVVALVQLAGAGVMDRRLVYDSLRDVEPWQRRQWLAERGLNDYYKAHSWKPTIDSGLRSVGRWSYGPSVKVSLHATADDTIVCLARGSGASIIRFRSRDSLTLDLLSDINCNGIVSRAIIADTLVYCGMNQGGTGIEVWGVSDLTSPHRLSYFYLPPVMDMAVKDTFLYATGYVQDSLRIFNVADPRNPVQVGACSDSGYPMCLSGDYCYLADRGGINIIDVSNPTSPHRVGKAATGGIAISVTVRDSLCFIGVDDVTLRVFDVKDPTLPYQVGSLSGIEAHDVYLPPTCDTVLYTPKLHVINVTNPASPRQIGFVDCPGWDYGVVTVPALSYALVADYFDGLVAVAITNPALPRIERAQFAADMAQDIAMDNGKAYIADYHSGLQILDIASPSTPVFKGRYDTSGTRPSMMTAVARDSFAYVGWSRPKFVSVDVSDPAHPTYAGFCLDVANSAEDMVLRDTFVYVVEQGKLRVVNVARPREPELVGSCVLSATGRNVVPRDNVAYVAMGTNGLVCIGIGDPGAPVVIGSWGGRSSGVAIADTIAYVVGPYTGLVSLNVADPAAPYVIDSLYLSDTLWWNDVALDGALAYVGGERVLTVDVSNPANLRVRGSWTPPYLVQRLAYSPPYLYAACLEAGVCILESTAVGVDDKVTRSPSPAKLLRVEPNPAHSVVLLTGVTGTSNVSVFDVIGQDVTKRVRLADDAGPMRMGIEKLPRGLYFVFDGDEEVRNVVKFVKQ